MNPLGLLLAALAVPLATAAPAPHPDYVAEIGKYRAEREERLRSEYGWLALAGLWWLEPGDNSFGKGASNTIVLPGERTPERAGSLVYDGRTVRIKPAPGAGVTLGGQPLTGERQLADDSQGDPDLLQLGRVQFYVIARDGRHAVRVKDPDTPARREFRGIDYFPIDPAWRVEATLRPWSEPREVKLTTVRGTSDKMRSPGSLEFEIGGKKLSLEAFVEPGEEHELFIIFRDETAGRETYGAGRYLSATLEGGKATLDFNRAYNPPCAFTSYATCPVPPRENHLPLRITAGERAYGHP